MGKFTSDTPIKDQLVQVAINTRNRSGIDPRNRTILPYDPANAPDADDPVTVIAANYADNSDFDFSKNAYIASGAGDGDYECYNFYRQRFIKVTDVATTAASSAVTSASNPFKSTFTYPMDFVLLNGAASGAAISGYINRNASDGAALLYSDAGMTTPLNVYGTLTNAVLWMGTTLAESAANALKYAGHSLYAANEGTLSIIPRWDRTNGWGELGSNLTTDAWDIATPLPLNFIRAGLTFYFRLIVSRRSGATPGGPYRISFGIFDATTTQKRFLESSNLTLTAGPVGTTGATTYNYCILADLDDGTTVASNVATFANGNATLSTSNYNRLTWTNAPNILNYRIYREKGGVVKRIFTIRNGAHDYNDYGTDEGETPVALPTAGALRPVAYAVSREFTLTGTGTWQNVLMSMEIPATYDSSLTTGKQWLRFGIEGVTGDARELTFDRVMLSTSDGGWQRSARDLNKILSQTPTSLPTTSGGQGSSCFTLDTPVLVCDKFGANLHELPIGEIEPGMFVFSGNRVHRVVDVVPGWTTTLIHARLSSGVAWRCSPSERFITSKADRKGTPISELTLGDEISGWRRDRKKQAEITRYQVFDYTDEPMPVRTLVLRGGKTFCVGQLTGWRKAVERARNRIRRALGLEPQFTKAVAHNRKSGDEIILV